MKHFREYTANTITITISFIVNFTAAAVFLYMLNSVIPLQNFVTAKIMSYTGLEYNIKNTIILIAGTLTLIPLLLYRSTWINRYATWNLDTREPNEKEQKRFNEALRILCEKNNDSPENYKMLVSDIEDYNAYAIGDNIIVLTAKVLAAEEISEKTIAGLLAHEVGHLKQNHTNIAMVCNTISLIGCVTATIYRTLSEFFEVMQSIPLLGILFIFPAWTFKLFTYFQLFILKLPEMLISSYHSRNNEYEADDYACKIGMGFWLISALKFITQNDDKRTKAEKILSNHPEPEERLTRIRNYVAANEDVSDK